MLRNLIFISPSTFKGLETQRLFPCQASFHMFFSEHSENVRITRSRSLLDVRGLHRLGGIANTDHGRAGPQGGQEVTSPLWECAPLLTFLPWDHDRLDGSHVSGALAESRLRLLKRKPMCNDGPKIDLSRGGESNRTRVDPRIAIHAVN
jgi:hypothetical protein